jgi:flagellar basal body P-ring formation protein FlgA
LSKLQHLTQLNMQMLCPIIPDTYRAKCLRWGAVLALSALPLVSVAGPFEDLEQEVVQWANTTPAFQGRNMRVAPLDSRITLQNCQQKLQFDQPFPVQPSVRVRCSQPQWQLFVTLTSGTESASPNRQAPIGPTLHKVLVAKEMLKRGTLITPSMFKEAEMPIPGMENQVIVDSKLLVNMELVRDLTPNSPLRTYDVKVAVLVKRGQEVQVSAGQGQGFMITMRAEALQDGGLGEQVRLKNSESGRSLIAVITGPNTARIR